VAVVVQVSEHASWCLGFYSRIMEAALAAAGAPAGLVSFVTGYGDAGHALVTGGVDKVGGGGRTRQGRAGRGAGGGRRGEERPDSLAGYVGGGMAG